ALRNLAEVLLKLGDLKGAEAQIHEALSITRSIQDRLAECNALGTLGIVCRASGRRDDAFQTHAAQLKLAKSIEYPGGQAHALTEMGEISAERSDWHKAISFYSQILPIMRGIGNQRAEATCLWYLSSWYEQIGDRNQAISFAELAFSIFTEIGDERAEQVLIELTQWQNESWLHKKIRKSLHQIKIRWGRR